MNGEWEGAENAYEDHNPNFFKCSQLNDRSYNEIWVKGL